MKIALLNDSVPVPTRGTAKSAGMDIYIQKVFDQQFVREFSQFNINPGSDCFIDASKNQINIHPFGKVRVQMNIRVEVPEGCMLLGLNKSGVSWTDRVSTLACVVDSDYSGNVFCTLVNHSSRNTVLLAGQKLIQLVCVPVQYPDIEIVSESEIHLIPTERGAGSMGSTGK
jgi:deoxyuridine 5'-triphosphate nucleotidohydrolase